MAVPLFVNNPPANHNTRPAQGFIALTTALLVAAVGTVIGISLLLFGLATTRTSFALDQSYQARAVADACAEEALQQIRDSTNFQGTATISLGQGSCTYTVTQQVAQDRTIAVSATVSTMVRRLSISVSGINPVIIVTSWQEVAN